MDAYWNGCSYFLTYRDNGGQLVIVYYYHGIAMVGGATCSIWMIPGQEG